MQRLKRRHATPGKPSSRTAFTLLELMVAMTIIGILMALAFPAYQSVMRGVRRAEVKTDLTKFESSLMNFASDNGIGKLPPSYIVLTEDPSNDPWPQDSKSKIRGMWPQFDFSLQHDFNQDGVLNGDPEPGNSYIRLSGDECLVFFLGGPFSASGGTASAPLGFSKNIRNPFEVTTENRIGPFFEFDFGRLIDVDGDGMPSYLDTLPGQKTPIMFLSASPSKMREVNDTSAPFNDDFDVRNDPTRDMAAAYIQADGRTPWKAKQFQLISPGEDAEYGAGGVYANPDSLSGRLTEQDNITNFANTTTLGD